MTKPQKQKEEKRKVAKPKSDDSNTEKLQKKSNMRSLDQSTTIAPSSHGHLLLTSHVLCNCVLEV